MSRQRWSIAIPPFAVDSGPVPPKQSLALSAVRILLDPQTERARFRVRPFRTGKREGLT